MKRKAAVKTRQQKPRGQLVLSQIQVGLALGCIAISLMLALGIGFIVGMWYQASEDIAPYAASQTPPAQSAPDHPMTFYSTLSESGVGPGVPARRDREDAVGTVDRPAPHRRETVVKGATPSSALRYSVQVGSFRGWEQAEKLRDRLARKGYSARIQTSRVPGKGLWYRVRVGYFSDRTTADRVAQRLVSHERLSVLIASESP
jgi:cell division protein FtsN